MKCRLRKQCSRLSFFKPTFLTWKSCWTVAASQRQARERESETEKGAARQSTGEGDAHSSSEIRRGEREMRAAAAAVQRLGREMRATAARSGEEREMCAAAARSGVWGERCAQ
ncbi:hypothetical protein AAC387_Pa03g3959 [Persea americana]